MLQTVNLHLQFILMTKYKNCVIYLQGTSGITVPSFSFGLDYVIGACSIFHMEFAVNFSTLQNLCKLRQAPISSHYIQMQYIFLRVHSLSYISNFLADIHVRLSIVTKRCLLYSGGNLSYYKMKCTRNV